MLERRPIDGGEKLDGEVRFEDSPLTPSREEVARLAYAMWEARGCGEGSPEQDWFEAEQQLKRPKAQTQAA